MNMIVGVFFLVCLNKFFIFEVLILINILMKLELFILKKGIFVFFVIVFDRYVLLVLGGFIISIFFGIFVFNLIYFLGFFKKFIIFCKFFFFLFSLVIFLNVILVFLLFL